MNPVHFMSVNHKWETQDEIYQELNKEFHFDFDPCPPNPTFNGLVVNWGNVSFCNPPYGREISKWIQKGYQQYLHGKTVVFLIPSRTDTQWWHKYVMKATEIRFIEGRLRFKGAKHNAPFPSCIVVFRADDFIQFPSGCQGLGSEDCDICLCAKDCSIEERMFG